MVSGRDGSSVVVIEKIDNDKDGSKVAWRAWRGWAGLVRVPLSGAGQARFRHLAGLEGRASADPAEIDAYRWGKLPKMLLSRWRQHRAMHGREWSAMCPNMLFCGQKRSQMRAVGIHLGPNKNKHGPSQRPNPQSGPRAGAADPGEHGNPIIPTSACFIVHISHHRRNSRCLNISVASRDSGTKRHSRPQRLLNCLRR